MKCLLLALGAGVAVATPLATMADSFIKRGVPSSINYSQMVLYTGFELAYNITGDEKYASWYRGQIDKLVLSDGTIQDWDYDYYSLDNYRMGNNLLYWYEKTGEGKYKSAASIIVNNSIGTRGRPPGASGTATRPIPTRCGSMAVSNSLSLFFFFFFFFWFSRLSGYSKSLSGQGHV